MSQKFPDVPLMGDMVFYFDEDKRPYAAFVAYVHNRVAKGTRRPICNLAIFKHDGRVANRVDIAPATFDNNTAIWKVLDKWAWPDEVPASAYNGFPSPTMRSRKFGAGETIVP